MRPVNLCTLSILPIAVHLFLRGKADVTRTSLGAVPGESRPIPVLHPHDESRAPQASGHSRSKSAAVLRRLVRAWMRAGEAVTATIEIPYKKLCAAHRRPNRGGENTSRWGRSDGHIIYSHPRILFLRPAVFHRSLLLRNA